MIPPVSEREKRPCFDCVAFNWEDTSCNVFDLDYIDFCRPNDNPCKYHLTAKEMKKLLDNLEK